MTELKAERCFTETKNSETKLCESTRTGFARAFRCLAAIQTKHNANIYEIPRVHRLWVLLVLTTAFGSIFRFFLTLKRTQTATELRKLFV